MNIDKNTKALLRDPEKRRAWVKYQFQIRGRSLSDVAKANGVTRQCLYHVFRIHYPRMEKVLADALGLRPCQLFPDRYDADGLPLSKRQRSKSSTRRANRNVERSSSNRYKEAA